MIVLYCFLYNRHTIASYRASSVFAPPKQNSSKWSCSRTLTPGQCFCTNQVNDSMTSSQSLLFRSWMNQYFFKGLVEWMIQWLIHKDVYWCNSLRMTHWKNPNTTVWQQCTNTDKRNDTNSEKFQLLALWMT